MEVTISLSNLFKQQYLVNVGSGARVINSDARFLSNNPDAQLEGYEASDSEALLDGVFEGLKAEEVILEPQPSTEEILAQAHQEAEHIVAQAQAEAIQITRESKRQAEMLYERTKLEAYKDGVSKLQDEILEKTDELNAKYKEREETLWAEYEEKLDTLEENMVDVMIQVFNKVFHIQFDNKKQILLQLIKDTLLGVDAGKEFIIRVSEANYKYVESHVADIKEKIGNDVTIDVVSDVTMDEEACIIETATGVYDCGMDMVMTNLEKDIRSLCR